MSLLFYLEETEKNNEHTIHYFESDSAWIKCEDYGGKRISPGVTLGLQAELLNTGVKRYLTKKIGIECEFGQEEEIIHVVIQK